MIDYGKPPALDEIEITLFGPGYGEAISVHLGNGAWLLVDSCIDPNDKAPASAVYLDQLNVSPEQVRTIVASHWHDDHVRGISQLADKYLSADFVISGVLNSKEATAFLSAYNNKSSDGLGGGTKELYNIIKNRDNVHPAFHKCIVFQDNENKCSAFVTALSPVPQAFLKSIAHFAQHLAKKNGSINNAAVGPNLEALVLHIDLGDDAILLGSDMEDHKKLGWTAVMDDQWSGSLKPAAVYKIAHHGSITGDNPQIWSTLLEPNPIACLTPWTRGGTRLPKEADRQRIKRNTLHSYIASDASRRPQMDREQLKRLQDIGRNVQLVDSGFGAVRLRKKAGAQSWNVELFGAAQKL